MSRYRCPLWGSSLKSNIKNARRNSSMGWLYPGMVQWGEIVDGVDRILPWTNMREKMASKRYGDIFLVCLYFMDVSSGIDFIQAYVSISSSWYSGIKIELCRSSEFRTLLSSSLSLFLTSSLSRWSFIWPSVYEYSSWISGSSIARDSSTSTKVRL